MGKTKDVYTINNLKRKAGNKYEKIYLRTMRI